MKDRQEYLKYLLARKNLTSEEKEWLLNYLDGRDISDVEKVAAEDFESDLLNGRQSLDSATSESLLENIRTRIEIPQRSFARLVRLHRLKIAVTATIILLAGAGYWLKGTKSTRVPVQQQQVVTTGKRKKIQLADGSLITLEPNSRLSYPGKFTGYTRDVALTGEAYFEVEHKPEHPFVVHSPYVNVTVLGTSFNVEAYENGVTKVVVSTGSVKVQTTDTKEQQAVIINSNQSVVYNNKTSEIEKKEAQDDALYYKERHLGRFTYNGIAITKVIAEMERYYHIQVTLPQNMGNCVFYGYFQSDDSVEKALSLVALAMNATVQKNSNGTGYSIVGGNCR